MPDITRQSVLLREDLMELYGRAWDEWPQGAAGIKAAFERAVLVDNGIAGAVLLARSGASEEDLGAIRRHRDGARKRRERRAS